MGWNWALKALSARMFCSASSPLILLICACFLMMKAAILFFSRLFILSLTVFLFFDRIAGFPYAFNNRLILNILKLNHVLFSVNYA